MATFPLNLSVDWPSRGLTSTFEITVDSHGSDSNQSHSIESVWRSIRELNPPCPGDADESGWRLVYLDNEADEIELSTDQELREACAQAVRQAQQSGFTPILQLRVLPASFSSKALLLAEPDWEPVNMRASMMHSQSSGTSDKQKADAPSSPDVVVVADSAASVPTATVDTSAGPVAEASSWSLFGIFSRSQPSAGAASAPSASPSLAVSSDSSVAVAVPASAPSDSGSLAEGEGSAPLSALASQILNASGDISCSISSQELDEDSSSFVACMAGVNFTPSLRGARGDLADSADLSAQTLAEVFRAMLTRTEQRLGFDLGMGSPDRLPPGVLVATPQAALLAALRNVPARAFEPAINLFAEIAVKYVQEAEINKQITEELSAHSQSSQADLERGVAPQAELPQASEAKAELSEVDAEQVLPERVPGQIIQEQPEEQVHLGEPVQLDNIVEPSAVENIQIQQFLEPQVQAPPLPLFDPLRPPVAAPLSIGVLGTPVASPIMEEQARAARRFDEALVELRSMGFTDDPLNTYLLRQNKVDITATLDWLMADAATNGQLRNELEHVIGPR